MSAKPLKSHQTLNQAPRSAKHGQHRRSSPPVHGRAVERACDGAGGADQTGILTITVQPGALFTWQSVAWFSNGAPEPAAPPAIPYAGIRTGELIGHRLWWVIRERGEPWLCSLAHRQLWRPGEVVEGKIAEVVQDDLMFDWRIWGGVYSFRHRDDLALEVAKQIVGVAEVKRLKADQRYVSWRFDWSPTEETFTFVSGTVKMWGDVVEHERGYRAQFAKLDSLDAIYGDEATLAELRAKYLPSFRVTGTNN